MRDYSEHGIERQLFPIDVLSVSRPYSQGVIFNAR